MWFKQSCNDSLIMEGFVQIASMFPHQTIELKINGQPVKIHLVSTGAVSVKTKFRDATKTGFLAMLDFILDKKFTEWMPIWVLIIEHPEGVFVIDTGENANVSALCGSFSISLLRAAARCAMIGVAWVRSARAPFTSACCICP